MGTKNFFKANNPKIGASGQGLGFESRAIGSAGNAARNAGLGAQKQFGVALGLNKSKFKPQKTDGAYAKGPKL